MVKIPTPDTICGYNASGQPLSISSGGSPLAYTYDAANQLLTETQALVGFPDLVVGHTYDADGNPATTTYPSGKVVSYAWTPRHQLASVSNDGPPPLATYSYDASGNLLALAHENGVTETKAYDAANRLLSTVQSTSAGTLSGHSYTLDATGRRTAETFGDGSTPARSYGYDATDQVTGATYGSGQSDSYAYDAMGNRTSATLARNAGATTAYTSNAANQYTALTGSAAPTYDPNGNLLTANGVTYTWDSQDRLLTASDGAATLAYTYDPLGRRTTKTAATAATTMTTRYALDGWNVIEEYQGGAGATPALAKIHTWGADLSGALQGAGGVGGLLLTETPAGGTHFHYDGNVTTLTGSAGTVTASYRYDAFGNTLSATGPAAAENTYRFSTKPLDGEIAAAPLYYYGYRYYSAPMGRWLNRDPIGERGGMNLYGFVINDGVNKWDYLGNVAPLVIGGVAIGALEVAAAAAGISMTACLMDPACRQAAADLTRAAAEQAALEAECLAKYLACNAKRCRKAHQRSCFDCFHACRNDGGWPADCN